MKAQRSLQSFLLVVFAWMLMTLSVAPALAFDPPWPGGLPFSTTLPWPTAHPLSVGEHFSPSGLTQFSPPSNPQPGIVSVPSPVSPAPAPIPAPTPMAPAPAPMPVPSPAPAPISNASGASDPSGALDAAGNWQMLDPGATAWYRIGKGGAHMDVFLDVDLASNLSMLVFAPGDFNHAIGQGSPNKGNVFQLVWAGGHWKAEGDWMAKITNGNSVPVHYRLTSSARDVSNKSCYSYWEYIGSNLVYWTACE